MGTFVINSHQRLLLQSKLLPWMVVFGLIWGELLTIGKSFATELVNPNLPLRAKYTELSRQLLYNQFQRPLYLESEESSRDLKGEIFAIVNYPFADVNDALNNPAHWCDLLILHINIKYCHASANESGTFLSVALGKKYDQPLSDAYRVEFNYRGIITAPDYFAVELNALTGPLSTHDYHIAIEATPIKDGRTFLHFTYAYAFGLSGRIAMQGYLATTGRDKIGFSISGKQANGQPSYIKGVRGVVERNTMRYFLAIDAYLAALTSLAADRSEKRLSYWFKGTDQYASQLHEVEREEYLQMKRKEIIRQQILQ